MILKQGDITWVNLDPAKGTETKKTRPCIIVSNNQYNHYFNTVMVVPISSAKKYQNEEKYRVSPLFMTIEKENVHGTALLQHIRTIDPHKRINEAVVDRLTGKECRKLIGILKQFF